MADQRELWHETGHAVARLGVASGDDDADREDPGVNKHIEYRPPDAGEIDDELGIAAALSVDDRHGRRWRGTAYQAVGVQDGRPGKSRVVVVSLLVSLDEPLEITDQGELDHLG